MKKNRNKSIDLGISFLLFFSGLFIAFLLNTKPLIGGLISLLPPIIYLSFRENKNWKKIFWAVLLFGIIWGFCFDLIETYNRAWEVSRLVFNLKFFNILPVDDVLGFMLMTLTIIVFYEHFIDDEKNKKNSKNLRYALVGSLLFFLFIIIFFTLNYK